VALKSLRPDPTSHKIITLLFLVCIIHLLTSPFLFSILPVSLPSVTPGAVWRCAFAVDSSSAPGVSFLISVYPPPSSLDCPGRR